MQCDPVSNLSNILYPFNLSAGFIKIGKKITQATLRTQSWMWVSFGTQGQIIPKWIVWSCRNSNSSKILCLSKVICNFHEDPIKNKQAMLRKRSNRGAFSTKGQVTPKSIIQYARFRKRPRFYACPDYLQGGIWVFSALKGKYLQSW